MDNEEIQGKKFSEFPSVMPGSADEVVGLHSGDNARFTVANFILAIRQGLANLFVPLTRTINNKALSSDITLDASDVGAVDADNVGVADGVASLDSNGKVPGTQLDLSGKQDEITANGILKGDGAGGVTAATPGTDYGTYSKPIGGIPSSDMTSAVQTSLGKADTAYQKPSSGIPASDLATGLSPFVNFGNRIHTLSGYNASWVATQNCYCVAQMGADANMTATVSLDGIMVVGSAQAATAAISYPYVGTFYVKQGQTVSTRNVATHNYYLSFYALY